MARIRDVEIERLKKEVPLERHGAAWSGMERHGAE